jgi:hypothetical protein
MANGQVVLVTTEGLSGGPSTRTVNYVAEEDPIKAEAIVAKIMAPNEKVEAFGLLPEAAVKALGLTLGEFTKRPLNLSRRPKINQFGLCAVPRIPGAAIALGQRPPRRTKAREPPIIAPQHVEARASERMH